MTRIAVDYDETPKTYIRDDVSGVKCMANGMNRLRIVEAVGPITQTHSRLLPLNYVEPQRPFGKKYYTTPNRKTQMALRKAETEGLKRLDRISRRKLYPKNAEEREAIRRNKKMVDEFRITEDLDRPDYYQELKNRRHWYDPIPANIDTFTEAEERLHECWKTSHNNQENWSDAKWAKFWNHALSRSAMKDYRLFK